MAFEGKRGFPLSLSAASCFYAWFCCVFICCQLLLTSGDAKPPCGKAGRSEVKDCCCISTCKKTCKPVSAVIQYTYKNCMASMNMSKCNDNCMKKKNIDYKEHQCCCCQEEKIETRSGTLICNEKTIDFKYKNVLSCTCKNCNEL